MAIIAAVADRKLKLAPTAADIFIRQVYNGAGRQFSTVFTQLLRPTLLRSGEQWVRQTPAHA